MDGISSKVKVWGVLLRGICNLIKGSIFFWLLTKFFIIILFTERSQCNHSCDSAFSVFTDKSHSLGTLNDFPKLSRSLCENYCDITGSNGSLKGREDIGICCSRRELVG